MKKRWSITFLTIILSLSSTKANAAIIDRFGGLNRYETAAKINNQLNSKTLILVSGHDFADALVAAPLVHHLDGEIHITENNKLSQNTIDSLNKNEFNSAVIVGGNGVVSQEIENQLKQRLKSVRRYSGKNRYSTSRQVANAIINTESNSNFQKYPYAFLVSGKNFPDALSIASVSAMTGSPILLTDGNVSGVDLLALEAASNKIYKIGGEAVVGNEMDKYITTSYTRLGGSDRYETNKLVVQEFSNLFNRNNVYIASGLDYPDALTGSALAGKNKQAIILSNKSVSNHSKDAVKIITPSKITALGGEGVITQSMLNTLNTFFEEQINKEVFRLINLERKKANLSELSWSDEIFKYSNQKSKDMAINKYFEHYDLSGKYSYNYMLNDGVKFNIWAENIITAANNSNVSNIAQDMVTRWMNSTGHRENILNPNLNNTGVGVYVSGNIIYGTQIFLRK